MTDITDAPLSRTPARFFFETGFFGAYAEATVRNGNKPLFDLTDAAVDRAWEIAREAHPNPAEFDHELHRANSADQQLRDGETAYRTFEQSEREADGSPESLARVATMLRTYAADLFPANRAGQVHFARVLMDSAATVIDAALSYRFVPQGWIDRATQIETEARDLISHVQDAILRADGKGSRFYAANIFQCDGAIEATLAAIRLPEPPLLPALGSHSAMTIDQIAASMAKADGLDWAEVCGYETDAGECDSSTCVAAWYEDHDPDSARAQYQKYARVALGIAEPAPIRCLDAPVTQRFVVGDQVSHNAGLIEDHTKRQVTAVLGYDPNGGAQYRLALPAGEDRGLAYDCELDPWPGDDAVLPIASPRNNPDSEGGR